MLKVVLLLTRIAKLVEALKMLTETGSGSLELKSDIDEMNCV